MTFCLTDRYKALHNKGVSRIRRAKEYLLKAVCEGPKYISKLKKKKLWDNKAILLYKQFISKGDLCFDVGANIGNRTDLFLILGATVVCVEPQQKCFDFLQKKYKKTVERVILIDKALGSKKGKGQLNISNDSSVLSTMSDKWMYASRFSENYSWSNKQEVEVTTLDELISIYGKPKFCKIDVEGYETEVLKGLTKPIPVISFEFVKENIEDADYCMDYISTIGKTKFNCSIGESMELISKDWITKESLIEKLNQIDDDLLWGDIFAWTIYTELCDKNIK